ncbi:hypothetical protein PENSPDRAFT_478125 [Peniophora sp. CONT]|nr:hypothetical protein PENSPDRAFT_478125 [Peniophora sp. CONT]
MQRPVKHSVSKATLVILHHLHRREQRDTDRPPPCIGPQASGCKRTDTEVLELTIATMKPSRQQLGQEVQRVECSQTACCRTKDVSSVDIRKRRVKHVFFFVIYPTVSLRYKLAQDLLHSTPPPDLSHMTCTTAAAQLQPSPSCQRLRTQYS